MTPNHPITTTFPLGLFCIATMSGPLPRPVKTGSLASTNNLAPDASPLELENNGLKDNLYREDVSD
jgi:hypothetical protein